MRIRITRKNKKRRDPRYFLQESVEETAEETVEESYRIPGSEEDMSRPGAHNITPEVSAATSKTYPGAERMLKGLDDTRPGDFPELAQALVDRVAEFNKLVAERGGQMGRHINLEELLDEAKKATEYDSEYLEPEPSDGRPSALEPHPSSLEHRR